LSIPQSIDAERAALFPIILSPHNPEWTLWYKDEEARLKKLLGERNIARVRHYGSTSVPDLIAKPIVDILLELADGADADGLLSAFPYPEYIVIPNPTAASTPDTLVLKGYTPTGFDRRVFHIHIRPRGDYHETAFRDYLLSHPKAAAEYAELKLDLFKRYEYDRDGYTNAKSAFINGILGRIRANGNEKL
jgi:GrpB-like predicted nucleotidyltransferase (UPF0157 family)